LTSPLQRAVDTTVLPEEIGKKPKTNIDLKPFGLGIFLQDIQIHQKPLNLSSGTTTINSSSAEVFSGRTLPKPSTSSIFLKHNIKL